MAKNREMEERHMKYRFRTTEDLIEQYTCYIDGKMHLSSRSLESLEKQLKKRSYRGIDARKLLKIFTRCADQPNLFA